MFLKHGKFSACFHFDLIWNTFSPLSTESVAPCLYAVVICAVTVCGNGQHGKQSPSENWSFAFLWMPGRKSDAGHCAVDFKLCMPEYIEERVVRL